MAAKSYDEKHERRSFWTDPPSAAKVIAAVVAGVFGVITVLISTGDDWLKVLYDTRSPVAHPEVQPDKPVPEITQPKTEPPFDFPRPTHAERIAEIKRALRDEPGAVAIRDRLAAIEMLTAIVSDLPSDTSALNR